jgi:hypothetical protein
MFLRRTGASKLSGTSLIYDLNSSDPFFYGIMELSGRVINGSFLFKETRIIEQNPPPGLNWCLKGGRLKISGSKGKALLRGSWSASNCGSGKIKLQKQ